MSASVRKSGAACGPRIARISHSREYSGRARKRRAARRAGGSPTGSRSPACERAALEAAERAHRVGRAGAEQRRHVDPAGDRDVEAEARARARRRSASSAPPSVVALPQRDLLAVERHRRLGAADRDVASRRSASRSCRA